MAVNIVADERVERFIAEGLQYSLTPPYTVIGLEKDGVIVGGVLLNVFEGEDVHFSAVGTGWTRDFMRAFGKYVFDTLGCIRCTAVAEEPEVIKLAQKMGGKIEGRMRNHFGVGRDGVIVGILKEEYRF